LPTTITAQESLSQIPARAFARARALLLHSAHSGLRNVTRCVGEHTISANSGDSVSIGVPLFLGFALRARKEEFIEGFIKTERERRYNYYIKSTIAL